MVSGFSQGTDRLPYLSIAEEWVVIEIWVPLPVVLGVGFIGRRAGAEVGRSVSLCHSCVWEGCTDLFPNQGMEQLIGTF